MQRKKEKDVKGRGIKKEFIIYLIIYLAALILVIIFDVQITKAIASLQPSLRSLMFFFASNYLIIFLFIILFVLLLYYPKKRKHILTLALTIIFSLILTVLLKKISMRSRPFEQGIVTTFQKTFSSWNTSFPSLHASLMFSAIPLVKKEFPSLKYAWIFFAFFIAFSRSYFALHYATDVFIGAIIGYLVGILFSKISINKIK